jgi:proteic killer suppression protein
VWHYTACERGPTIQIEFRTRRLERNFREADRAVRAWGADVGRRYVTRLIIVQDAPSMAALYEILSLRFHPLTGDRSGQYAASLTGRWRVIFERVNDRTLRVVDVEDYHG